ncbi:MULTISPECIES: Dps family protein [unclassified Flavobacterium]|uniref:Dps family protein n=1 Tax=unclassified Flavobacterium TaxID=196869 RepID=UPI002091BC3C|nr:MULTISPECIES: DNA starvation/stationary phase protection protein [unclassified Flavobacterium]MCO6163616.1 DNA starvation/stationary phase protection protein [Flavobacterium sp. NRK F7]|tara:strand:- start:169 stop:648 length:480 start_codon:yes stop_codon:yes gene_type:complete
METMLAPKIGLEKKELSQSIKDLTVVLSNEMVLYVKSRKFHWNVTGNSFMELHKLFENQYSKLEKTIDEVAERISKLGGKTIGTMKEFIENSILKEESKYVNQNQMLEELLDDHEKIIIQLREFIEKAEDAHDAGTADFLTGVLQDHESKSWILRKYLS